MALRNTFYFRRAFLFAYNIFIKPRSNEEDDRRKEFILNVLLCCLIVLFILLALDAVWSSFIQGALFSGVDPRLMLVPLVVLIWLHVLSRTGFAKFVAIVFVWLLYAVVILALWQWGIGLPQAWLFCAIVISFSAQLIGTSYSFVVTLSVCFAFVFLLLPSKPEI